jgi:hypothetical protein
MLVDKEKSRILFYYQTFTTLKPILISESPVTHIHVSSIHFGVEANSCPYIHLNNESPYDYKFDNVWSELEQAAKLGIKVKIMVGGAGGGYATLFSNFKLYYSLLADLLRNKQFISGVDLDIEEPCSLENVKLLIRTLKEDFGNGISISMAPIQSSLESDEPGMAGFVYKDLLHSQEGKCIDYFNVQFYSDFSCEAYDTIVKNGYLPEMIVMGALAGSTNLEEITKCAVKYKNNYGGAFVWEYCFAKPTPLDWSINIYQILKKYCYLKH